MHLRNAPRQLVQVSCLSVALIALVSLAGCAQDEDEEVASASVTSALQASQNGGLTHDIIDVPAESALDPMKVAAAFATRKPAGISPEGCMTRTQTGASVHLVFAGCTGPFGKVRLDGAADVTFKLDEERRLVADLIGTKLRANDRPLQYKAQAIIRSEGDVRDVTWHAEASGQTKRGKDYSRSTDLAFRVDTVKRCLEGSGSARGTVAGFNLDITVDALAVCERACPKQGSVEATLAGPRGRERSMSVTFDGSDQAHVKTSKGKTLDIAMACDEGEAAQ